MASDYELRWTAGGRLKVAFFREMLLINPKLNEMECNTIPPALKFHLIELFK